MYTYRNFNLLCPLEKAECVPHILPYTQPIKCYSIFMVIYGQEFTEAIIKQFQEEVDADDIATVVSKWTGIH
ncbi:hypothetical protein B188_00750 [Candidatus Brocadiaceae bacterium B188]|nr:hypothetical protein B188_00750 [Candidatus Brocadiaceae bacterium B188]